MFKLILELLIGIYEGFMNVRKSLILAEKVKAVFKNRKCKKKM